QAVARFLIDSHIFLWAIESPEMLSSAEQSVLADGQHEVVVSVASIWELSIKIATGRMGVADLGGAVPPDHFERAAERLGIPIITIVTSEAEYMRRLPLIHRDPFDRMLIAQALLTGRIMISRDAIFARYPGLQLFPTPLV